MALREHVRRWRWLVAASCALSRGVTAQTGLAVFVGRPLDVAESNLAAGFDAWLAGAIAGPAFNPRVVVYPRRHGGHATQVDANLIYQFPVLDTEWIRPFGGVGAARVSGDLGSPGVIESSARTGFNLVSGATAWRMTPQVYGQLTYTVLNHRANLAVIVVGLRWSPGHGRGG